MLGLVLKRKNWQWAAFGKHPVASEYLRPANRSPLQAAVASWMEQGFDRLPDEQKGEAGLCWYFWMTGPNGRMLCGRLASSTDRFGRTYPLLLIGEGKCGDIHRNWDLMPFACEDSWKHLDMVAGTEGEQLSAFEERLGAVEDPMVDWRRFKGSREHFKQQRVVSLGHHNSHFIQQMSSIDTLARKKAITVAFDEEHIGRFHLPAHKFLSLLMSRVNETPNMVLLGGRQEVPALTVLRNAPQPEDFYRLWTEEKRGHHGL